jgi:serine/alanine adding enzyme
MHISTAGVEGSWPLSKAQCPDVYFTPEYGSVAASTRGGDWRSLHFGDRLQLPFVVSTTGGGTDATSPYGYSGIHVSPECSAQDLQEFWRSVRDYWRETGIVAAFLRFSPLDDFSRQACSALEGLTLTRRGDTVAVSAEAGVEAVWQGMQGRSRTAVRRATKAGLCGEIRPAGMDDLVAGSPFRALYRETMERVNSAAGYVFDDAYYTSLLKNLGDDLMLVTVRQPDGGVVSASLIMVHQGRAHYHLSGSARYSSQLGANNLLLWTVLEWAASNEIAVVHLGGGVRPDDGLFRFKESFGGARTQFWTGALILDDELYGKLAGLRAEALGLTVDDLNQRGYFPAYRFQTNIV